MAQPATSPTTGTADETAATSPTLDTTERAASKEGSSADTSTPATAEAGPDDKTAAAAESADGLLFEVEKSMRYHARRRAHFEWWHRGSMLIVIVAGSATVASWAPDFWGLVAVITASFDLVYAPAVKVCEHERLHREFTKLAIAIRTERKPDEAMLRGWVAERLEIEADEPPMFWAVEADCWNEVARAWGRNKEPPNRLTWFQRLFKHFIRFEGSTFAEHGV